VIICSIPATGMIQYYYKYYYSCNSNGSHASVHVSHKRQLKASSRKNSFDPLISLGPG